MSNIGKDEQYRAYLLNHISGLKYAFKWLEKNIPDVYVNDGIDYSSIIYLNVKDHDYSKYTADEYVPYREYFYGDRTDRVKSDFDYAWLNHIHNNPHHWQYWVLYEDDGDAKALEIPFEYLIEMFLDHWSFSWNKGNLFEILDWYNNHKDKMILNDKSRKQYEELLDKVINKLNESET